MTGGSSWLARRACDLPATLIHLPAQLDRLVGGRVCPHCEMGVELGPKEDLLAATCPSCGKPLHVEDKAAEAAFEELQQRWVGCLVRHGAGICVCLHRAAEAACRAHGWLHVLCTGCCCGA